MNLIGMVRRGVAAWFSCAPSGADLLPAAAAGFQEAQAPFGEEAPLFVGIWYPSHDPRRARAMGLHQSMVAVGGAVAGSALPLVVMSHGSGGWYGAQFPTAMALADAGFVVAAVTHPGDTFNDRSRSLQVIDRPYHIRRVLDYMLQEWPQRDRIDARRIGMFGYSVGGFTTLVIAGGTPNSGRLDTHCREHPGEPICRVAREQNVNVATLNGGIDREWVHDPRVKAAVIAAPALGMLFGQDGLAGVRLPMQVWAGANDPVAPEATNAARIRQDLPVPPEYHAVPKASHVSFLPPCARAVARRNRGMCGDARGFNRRNFNMQFNAEVIRFFQATLPGAAP